MRIHIRKRRLAGRRRARVRERSVRVHAPPADESPNTLQIGYTVDGELVVVVPPHIPLSAVYAAWLGADVVVTVSPDSAPTSETQCRELSSFCCALLAVIIVSAIYVCIMAVNSEVRVRLM